MTRRRVLLVTAAIVLAVVGMVVIVAYVQSAEDRVLAGEDLATVLVATSEIRPNTEAVDVIELTDTVEIPKRYVQDGAVGTLQDLQGQVTTTRILPQQQIVRGQFGTSAQIGAGGGGAQIAKGKEIVTIALEPQRAVGGRIAADDQVSVIVSSGQAMVRQDSRMVTGKNPTGLVLSGVKVVAVEGGVSEDTGEAASSVLVSLEVPQSEAELIVFGMEHGTIWLTLNGQEPDEPDEITRTPENVFDPDGGL